MKYVTSLTDRIITSFWSRVDKIDNCWLWTGAFFETGYGALSGENRKALRAHRFSYLLHNPDKDMTNLLVCHSCDNPKCVNPSHLFLGTSKENSQDMIKKSRHGRKPEFRPFCPKGHSYLGDNLYYTSSGHQACRGCKNVGERAAYHSGRRKKWHTMTISSHFSIRYLIST